MMILSLPLRPRLSLLLLFSVVFVPCAGAQGEIGFVERFALATDRAEALRELIPGTEDFYFYSALHAQQRGALDEVDGLLEPWVARYGRTPKVIAMQHRQALLRYPADPAGTMRYLRDNFGLTFNHEQQRLDEKPDFPTALAPDQVTREAFLRQAFQRADLSGISEAGLDFLLRGQVEMTPGQRRELLSRLRYPDYDSLPGIIAADLRSRESGGFGEFEIHRRLTLAQLDELAGLRPELSNDPRFVEARLLRLQPSNNESTSRNPEAERARLDRLWGYVRTLPTAFGSLKASVLYRRLDEARRRGEYSREEFLAYIELPRAMPYMNPDYLREQQTRGFVVDLAADFTAGAGLPPIGQDEALVRGYLEHFFLTDETYQRFSPYLHEPWLKEVFASTKLLHGIGDPEEWFSMLSPAQVQQLKDRVEVIFAPSNREHLTVSDEVSLTVSLKNVKELIVKVYEINALNFYLDRKEEINTDIDLDGLVANEEKTYRYDEAPIRRHAATFSFDSLKGKRGIWVVELIGNGISSRALVRKGKLQSLSRTTVGGELLTVLDDENRPVKSPAVWFGGKRYSADEKGFVLLPFSESGTVPVVLTDGDFASLDRVELPQESYQLDAGVLLEQETLLPGAEASVALRPILKLNGGQVGVGNVKGVTLTVRTTDLDGIDSISEAKDFPLFDDRESTHAFRVPGRLRSVEVTLTGKVPSVVRPGETNELRFSRTYELNGIDGQPLVADSYLSRLGDRYVVDVLGKSGEPLADRPVALTLDHRDYTVPVSVTLKTDARGRIDLGGLAGIVSLTAHPEGFPVRRWDLAQDRVSRQETIHAKVGDTVEIPLFATDGFGRDDLAIFETRSGTLVEDVFSLAAYEDGFVRLTGLKPGDYEIVLKSEGRAVTLKVTDAGATHFDYALSDDRHLEQPLSPALQITSLEKKGEKISLTVRNADAFTRVHLVATRFLPQFDPFAGLDHGYRDALFEIRRGNNVSRFVSGRDIGEEYRYILERRGSKKFPGNMLSRPGHILNPWELNETETLVDVATEGEAHRKSEGMAAAGRAPGAPMPVIGAAAGSAPGGDSPSLNFLARQAIVLTNLEVGEGGTITLDLADLGDRQHLHVVAVNAHGTVYRQLALPEPDGGASTRDLRLETTLDPEKDFTRRRNVTLLRAGETLKMGDFRASEVQTYDTVGGIYSTLLGINPDGNFTKFGFVANWASLGDEEKRELYSEHASHELNFFLSRKDTAFLEAVVQPYLKHKKDKTFLDQYLIGANLERYLQPWEFSRLNIVERILLARRIGEDERVRTAGHVTGLHELIPPDPEQDAFFFRRALRGRSSDLSASNLMGDVATGGGFGFEDASPMARSRVTADALQRRGMPMAAPAPAAEAAVSEEMAADPFAAPAPAALGVSAGVSDAELVSKAKAQALYRVLESTRELAENNYYELPIAFQNADLVTVNGFWKDFAEWDGEGGFYSREFPAATSNFTEMMFALSLLDLPFASEKHELTVEDNVFSLSAASPLVVFHEEIQPAERAGGDAPVLVSQNFLRIDDRFRLVEGEQADKFVTDEFLTGVVYAGQIVVTNPTSSAHRLDLLVQIPAGAVPVGGSDYTKSYPVRLESFSTERLEVMFYFPSPSGEGSFAVYPVRVSKNEKVIAAGEVMTFKVVDQLSRFDEASWEYLSQFSSAKDVLDFLSATNLHRLDLSRIAWRVREDVDFFKKVTDLVAARHAYDDVLWSYGIHHNVAPAAREFLKHREDFLHQCGVWLESELVSLDPVERHWYQHLEYAPLVNARAHRLGRENKVLNDRFRAQYGAFLELAAYKPALSAEDRLAVSAYLSLQDRVAESLEWFDSIAADEVVSRLQYDYLKAYHALSREDVATAKTVAAAYSNYPVDRWQTKFATVAAQVREIEGGAATPDDETREGQIEQLSSKEPFIELTATGREAKLRYRNVKAATVNYYEMDLEFLFSSKPFVSGGSGQFSFIKPNLSEQKELPADAELLTFTIPEAFASRNVLVEVVAAGRTESVAIYSNSLKVQITAAYGQIEVLGEQDSKPLPRTYVKVYAKMKNGEVRFLKDGYTDLRGKFDYISLSTGELDEVEDLSLLVMSEGNGSLVREVAPPQR